MNKKWTQEDKKNMKDWDILEEDYEYIKQEIYNQALEDVINILKKHYPGGESGWIKRIKELKSEAEK